MSADKSKIVHSRAIAKMQEVCLHHRIKRAHHTKQQAMECKG